MIKNNWMFIFLLMCVGGTRTDQEKVKSEEKSREKKYRFDLTMENTFQVNYRNNVRQFVSDQYTYFKISLLSLRSNPIHLTLSYELWTKPKPSEWPFHWWILLKHTKTSQITVWLAINWYGTYSSLSRYEVNIRSWLTHTVQCNAFQ